MLEALDEQNNEIVSMEADEDEPQEPQKKAEHRGRLEEQRQEFNRVLERSDKAIAVLQTPEFRQALADSDYGATDETELHEARDNLNKIDQMYVMALRHRRKTARARQAMLVEVVDHIRKAKRRGRNLINKRPELKEEFCIGVQLDATVPSVRFQGPLVALAVKTYFDDLPNYSETDQQRLAQSLTTLEEKVVAQNLASIRVRQAHQAREAALETMREELADLRLAAEIAEETTPGILKAL